MRLTAHFTTEEFACHDGTPAPKHAYDDLHRLCRDHLEVLRDRWGPVRVISGYRHARYNAAVGGAPASFHIYRADRRGAAADVEAARGRPADWYRTLELTSPGGLGAYSGHVHVDNRAGRARW